MKNIAELIAKYNNNEINFVDIPYWSTDQKTILGETTFGNLLFYLIVILISVAIRANILD